MKKLLMLMFMVAVATMIVACDPTSGDSVIPDEYQDYFEEPQGEQVNLSLEELLTMVANAGVETMSDTEYPIMKFSTAGLVQVVVNTKQTEFSVASNNSIFFEFAQATHVQLAAFTDDVKVHAQISKFDLNIDSDDMFSDMSGEGNIDFDFTGGLYVSEGYGYYNVNLSGDMFGTPTDLQVAEKISTPIPHEPIDMTDITGEPVVIPDFDFDPESIEALLVDEFVGQIDAYENDGDYIIDVIFNKAFIVQMVTDMFNEYLGEIDPEDPMAGSIPELADVLEVINTVVKDFTFRLRFEITDGKMSKMAIYVDLDIDFVASEVEDIIDTISEIPVSRFKLLVEDFFVAVEYVDTFPAFPDFTNYVEVEEPSILEYLPFPGSAAPEPEVE